MSSLHEQEIDEDGVSLHDQKDEVMSSVHEQEYDEEMLSPRLQDAQEDMHAQADEVMFSSHDGNIDTNSNEERERHTKCNIERVWYWSKFFTFFFLFKLWHHQKRKMWLQPKRYEISQKRIIL